MKLKDEEMRELKARFRNGIIEPLEELELVDGQEITVVILDIPNPSEISDALRDSAGAWADLVDGERLKKNIYDSRSSNPRPESRL